MSKFIQDIQDFIGTYCTPCKNEDGAIVDLMMDNHKCINWDNEEYYLPEDIAYTEEEEIVYDYLVENHLV